MNPRKVCVFCGHDVDEDKHSLTENEARTRYAQLQQAIHDVLEGHDAILRCSGYVSMKIHAAGAQKLRPTGRIHNVKPNGEEKPIVEDVNNESQELAAHVGGIVRQTKRNM